MTRTPRLAWVDTGRGIAIILVVLFHTTNWISGTGLDLSAWADLNTVLSSLRMPMFFALSGMFATKWLTATWGDLLRTKVLLFLWVLAVWSVIDMAAQVWGLHAAGQGISLTSVARDLALALVKPLFELWFIWALAVFFVVAKATRRIPVAAQLVVAGLASAAALTLWSTLTTGLTGSAKFYFFFLGGLYLRPLLKGFAETRLWARASVILVWAVVSPAFFFFGIRAVPGMYFVNCLLGVLAGIALSTLLQRVALLPSLGRRTLPIYLAHTPIVVLISIVLLAAPALIDVLAAATWIVPPLMAAIAIATALGLHRAATASTVLRYLYEPPPVAVRALRTIR